MSFQADTRTLVSLLTILLFSHLVTTAHSFHLTIERRGGSLATKSPVDITKLTELVLHAESRYARSERVIEGNKVVRRWNYRDSDLVDGSDLMNNIGQNGSWFTMLHIGEPQQSIEMDLDMLAPDFYLLSTTSDHGSKFESFFSSTHEEHKDTYVHPACKLQSDDVHLFKDSGSITQRLDIAACAPPKYSRKTQRAHGGILGLSPPSTMNRLESRSLTQKLRLLSIVESDVWSLTLLNRQHGVLTLGGSIARIVEEAKIRTHVELNNIDNPLADATFIDREVAEQLLKALPTHREGIPWMELPWTDGFRWSSVEGAEGWWTTLMSGVWINGAKVLKNQPVLFDVHVPFILAPPVAAETFYKGISGAKKMPAPDDIFYVFPCLNPPNIAFEFDGWMFPTMSGGQTTEDAFLGPHGGRLSLGQVREGSGYCVGAVVESRFGLKSHGENGFEDNTDQETGERPRGGGLHQTWVLGEPFFQGTGVVFDAEEKRIGFRTY